MYRPSSRRMKSYVCIPTLGGLGLTMALIGKDDREEFASKKVVLPRVDPTREAGRGVAVRALSGVVLVAVLLPPSEFSLAGDMRPPCCPFTDLLLRRELNAEGGFVDAVVLEMCREPDEEKVSCLPTSNFSSSPLFFVNSLPLKTSSSYFTVFVP